MQALESKPVLRCFYCNGPIDGLLFTVSRRQNVYYEGGVKAKHFCSWDCVAKHAKRRARLDV